MMLRCGQAGCSLNNGARSASKPPSIAWAAPGWGSQARSVRNIHSQRCVKAYSSSCDGHQQPQNAVPHVKSVVSTNDSQVESAGDRLAKFSHAFWKFLRPHTIRGTVLGTVAVTTRALMEHPELVDWALLPRAALGLAALLAGNAYIVGINQIYDVDIDVVNKPFLPIAAGEMSTGVAWALVLGLAAVGAAIVALNFGPLLTGLYALGLLLGTIYSVPPLRLKRFAVPAFLIIAACRGFMLNFGVYTAARAALGVTRFEWSPAISFITAFVTLFATVIAITKDLPDIEGDRAHGIQTFATRMGVKAVALGAVALLLLNYAAAIYLGLHPGGGFRPLVMAGGHAALAGALLLATWRLGRSGYSRSGVLAFYGWIWNALYAEYALLPFI